MEYKEFYETNENFHKYVDKYCVKHEIDVDTAITHKGVQNVADYYGEAADHERNTIQS